MSKDSTEAVNGPKLAAEILKRLPKKDQERLATAIFRAEPELYAKVHSHLRPPEPVRTPQNLPLQVQSGQKSLVVRPSTQLPDQLPEAVEMPIGTQRSIQDEESQRRAVDELLNSAPRPAKKNGRYA